MKTVGEIVRERREGLGLTLSTLARAAKTTKGYLSMIENRRVARPPSERVLEALERALGIPNELRRAAEWECTPPAIQAEMARLAERARRGEEFAQWVRSSTERLGGAAPLERQVCSDELSRWLRKTLGGGPAAWAGGSWARPTPRSVPLVQNAAEWVVHGMGTGVGRVGLVTYIECPELIDPRAFATRVVGAAMAPDYREGDVVVFSPAAEFTDGCDGMVIFGSGHVPTFGRVFFEGERVRLQPLNLEFSPIVVSRKRVRAVYRAVWRFQKLD